MSSNVITDATPDALGGKIDSFFEISKRGSTFGCGIRGGFVTFFTMTYILVLNPTILSHALPKGGSIAMPDIAVGTTSIVGIMTILMRMMANYPMALVVGLGLNTTVAFTLVPGSSLSFQEAIGLIFWEGVVTIVLVSASFREVVLRAVPRQMKTTISVGIGLFIAFIGPTNGGIIHPQGGMIMGLGINGSLMGWPALAFTFGFLFTMVLYAARIEESILIGIMSSTILAVIAQLFAKLEVESGKVPTS